MDDRECVLVGLGILATVALAIFAEPYRRMSDGQVRAFLVALCILAAIGGAMLLRPFGTQIFGPYPIYGPFQ